MAALTKDRNTAYREGDFLVLSPADGVTIFSGSLTAVDGSGDLVPAADTAGLKVVGVADNYSEGEDVTVRKGTYLFENNGNITAADIGDKCYIVDDQTVGLQADVTNDVEAGEIFDVDSEGVWVKII